MILCCGEALIDMIPKTGEDGVDRFAPHAGGAVFNTAIGLGRLGVPTGFVSGVSRDLFGTVLTDALEASTVRSDLVVASDRPTTLAFVELNNGQARYTFYDENTAGRMLEPEALPELPETAQALYFGGISLISEPCADFYLNLALREAPRRVIVADPNIRTGFIKNEARYRARLDQLIAVTDILKVSDEDLDWILPGPASLVEKTKEIRAKGPAIVIVTRGSEGATAMFGQGDQVTAAARIVDVVDTVGAGDTFNSGFLAAFFKTGELEKQNIDQISGEKIEAALSHGSHVASITVSRAGANPPWESEL
ncbi:MAG: carbohydrate kinase [Pseudomonadota bacterium]